MKPTNLLPAVPSPQNLETLLPVLRLPTRLVAAILSFLAAGLVLLNPSATRAQSGSFNSLSTAAVNWNDSTRWTSGIIASGENNVADFSGKNISVNVTVTVDAGRVISDILTGDSSGANTWTFSGATLTLSNTTQMPQLRVLQNTATFNCVLDGANGMRKEQSAICVLNAANTYRGDTAINRGTLRLSNAGGIPSGTGKGNVVMNLVGGSPILDVFTVSPTINGLSSTTTSATVNSSSSAAGTSTLTVGANDAAGSFTGVIANGGGTRILALTKIGAGEQSLSGANTYSGATTISGGRLTGVTGGSCANSDLTVTATGTNNVQYTGSDATWTAKTITFNGGGLNIDLGTNQPSATVAPLTLSSGVTFSTTPTFNLDGPAIANGTYPLIKYTTSITSLGNMPTTATLPGGGTGIIQDNSGSQTIELVVGSGVFPPNIHWATGNGNWDTNTINWKGIPGNATNYVEGVPVQFKDTDATGSPVVTLNTNVQPSSVQVNASSRDYTLTGSGTIAGSASLSKSGSGALTLDLTNSYTGGSALSQGRLNIKKPSALGDVSGTLSLLGGVLDNASGGTMTNLDYPQSWGGDFAFAGTSDLNLGVGSVVLSGSRTVTVSNGTLTVGGNISGTGSGLIKAGAGTLRLDAGLNTSSGGTLTVNAGTLSLHLGNTLFLYNGDTRIVGGTLLVTHTNALMNTTLDMNIADGGALNCGTLSNVSIGSFKGSRSFGLTNGSGGALELNVGNKVGSSDSYQGTLSGSGSLVKIGTGVWQLGAGGAGNGIYTGDTRVTDGFLRAGANNAFPHGAGKGNMVIQAPGTLDFLDRTAISVNGLSGDGTVNDSDGGANPPGTICNFIIGDGGASAEFSGVIQNVAAPSKTSLVVTLIKTNSGTQILSGVNTYSGTTTVKGGTLLVNSPGSLPATTVTVNNGGTFGGTGTAGGSVSLANGGTLKPGASIGLLTIGGNLTMAAGSTNVFEVDLDTLSADQVSAGAVAYGGSLVVTNIGGTASATNGASMQIFTTAGSGTFAATNLPSLPTGLVWDLSTIGADGTIRIAASSVNTTPPTLTNHLSGNLLTLSWPLDHTGWILQAQTNSVNVGLTTNWFPVPGSSSTNQIIMTVNPANGTVFYRLFYP